MFRATEQIDHLTPGLKVIEQQAYPFQIRQHLEVFEQMGLAAHDQLAFVALAA